MVLSWTSLYDLDFYCVWPKPERIAVRNRVVPCVAVEVDSARPPDGILGEKAPRERSISAKFSMAHGSGTANRSPTADESSLGLAPGLNVVQGGRPACDGPLNERPGREPHASQLWSLGVPTCSFFNTLSRED